MDDFMSNIGEKHSSTLVLSNASEIQLKFTTPHYRFKLGITRTFQPLHKITFLD